MVGFDTQACSITVRKGVVSLVVCVISLMRSLPQVEITTVLKALVESSYFEGEPRWLWDDDIIRAKVWEPHKKWLVLVNRGWVIRDHNQ